MTYDWPPAQAVGVLLQKSKKKDVPERRLRVEERDRRTVKEKQLPALDDDFAQLASEFDTLDEVRADLKERLTKAKRMEQLYDARDHLP